MPNWSILETIVSISMLALSSMARSRRSSLRLAVAFLRSKFVWTRWVRASIIIVNKWTKRLSVCEPFFAFTYVASTAASDPSATIPASYNSPWTSIRSSSLHTTTLTIMPAAAMGPAGPNATRAPIAFIPRPNTVAPIVTPALKILDKVRNSRCASAKLR